MSDITHDDLCKIGVKLLRGRFGCCWAVREFVTHCQESPDCFGAKSCGAETYLLEAKVSRSDFLSDKKKAFRQCPSKGIGMFRYFIVPDGLVGADEIPEGWGLIEVCSKRKATIVKGKDPKAYDFSSEWCHRDRNHWGERAIAHSFIRRLIKGDDLSKWT